MPKPTKPAPRPWIPLAGVAVVICLLGLAVFVLLPGGGDRLGAQAAEIGGPFRLENGDGKPVTDRDFRGKYLLVYFGYTYCPDVCPTTLNEVASALQTLGGKAADLQPLFVSVDPQRDTPTVMKQYTAAFDPRIMGLTGTPDEIKQAAHEYRVYYAIHRTGPAPGDYTVDHSSILYLMGPDGKFIAPIRADEPGPAMAADIAKLMT